MRRPCFLEAGVHRAFGPALGVEHLVDQRMQPLAVGVIEADREPSEILHTPL